MTSPIQFYILSDATKKTSVTTGAKDGKDNKSPNGYIGVQVLAGNPQVSTATENGDALKDVVLPIGTVINGTFSSVSITEASKGTVLVYLAPE